jgi:hypothetical protein
VDGRTQMEPRSVKLGSKSGANAAAPVTGMRSKVDLPVLGRMCITLQTAS